MNVVIITPPLVQLNAPYPSGAYLSDFFKRQGFNSQWCDLSIELYYSIFSKQGLTKLFNLTKNKALKMAAQAEQQGDEATAFNLRRYISTSQNWIDWIDTINLILTGQGREKEHQFLFSPYVPRGNRMETFLANLDHTPTVDDVRFLCSYALADLSDYITAVFDQNFSLIRYAEAVTADSRTFTQIEQELDSPLLKEFYEPILNKFLGGEGTPLAPAAAASSATPSSEGTSLATHPEAVTFVCISIPFAGTYIPALYTARYLKQKYGKKVLISIGGGYVNTELRDFSNAAMEKYADFISYDRGYGSYHELFNKDRDFTQPVYKLAQFSEGKFIPPLWKMQSAEQYEKEITCKITPDYSSINFSRYLRVCDDTNPMHRLWTDGAWIKAYLAHGCYWHKCAFCDTKLDYVCGYKITEVEGLFQSLVDTAKNKGVYGIHFVDEALPPVALKRFALCNARSGNPLYFWGNVRFEKTFTKDLAAFLSYCGFGGASAGIEVATGKGLQNINKGTDLQSIVSACAAFKEAGILVHAYMIYAFWYDTPQTIIDSMETLRQFYAAGLLDSSFWHKFMLTKYSPKYDELKKSFNPNKYEEFGAPLEAALTAWMHGDKLEMKVQKWFNFPVPAPSVAKNLVDQCIENYEIASQKFELLDPFWLGSIPVKVSENKNQITYRWIYLQEENELVVNTSEKSFLIEVLENLLPSKSNEIHEKTVELIKKSPELQKQLRRLHNKGLVCI